MRNVTVKRDVLLERIKQNREAHREIVTEAFTNYRSAVIEELDKMLDDAKNGKRIKRAVGLIEPMDMTREYDLVIDMLENSVDDQIELDAQSYAQYMRDDWSWKQQFAASNIAYTVGKFDQ